MPGGFQGGQYRPLKEEEVRTIHAQTIALLEDPGIKVANPEAFEVFARHGAKVDQEKWRVQISQAMLEDALASAPKKIVLCGREEKNHLDLSGKRVYFGTGGTVLNILDLETGQRRLTTLQDLKDYARLVDALPEVHFFMIPVFPHEVSLEKMDVSRFYWSLANTSKHVTGGVYTRQGIQDVVALAAEIAGGKEKLLREPLISMVTCVVSPLTLDVQYGGFLVEVARQGIPLVCPSEPLAGATSPCTLAGTVLQCNAETLAGFVLAQLVRPGTPILYGTVATNMEMKTGAYLSGSVEMGLVNAACAQMAQFYGVPLYATAGMSDAKIPDIQAGYEKMATAMLTALAGANFIHDAAGFLEFCTTASFAQVVIDAEIIGMCMRAVRGIEVNPETLAVEVIRKVGPGGNFLSEAHTLKHFRAEFFYPPVADRQSRKAWEEKGAKDAAARARDLAREILRNHRPLPLPPEVEAKILASFPVQKDQVQKEETRS